MANTLRRMPLSWVALCALAIAVGTIALVATARASAADTPGDPSGSGVQPVLVDGNPDCATLPDNILPGSHLQYKIEGAPNDGTYTDSDTGFQVNITNADMKFFDWSSLTGVDAIIVKGGSNADVFVYDLTDESNGDTRMHAPVAPNGTYRDISHVSFCFDKEELPKLTATKTAEGFNDVEYDWTVEKSAQQSRLPIPQGNTGTVDYTINVTRTPGTATTGVRGEICATNDGEVATENLKLADRVQVNTGSGFEDVPGATKTIKPENQLGPGETKCYPYEIAFAGVPEVNYRNVVDVTITNHAGHVGDEFGPEAEAAFTIPATPTKEVDESARLRDLFKLPSRAPGAFSVVSGGLEPNPQRLDDSEKIEYSVTVKNDSAPCGKVFHLFNTAKLVELDTLERRSSEEVKVNMNTGKCPT